MFTSPTREAQAYHFAEWLELLAVKNSPQSSSQADLRSLLEGAGDDLALVDDPSEQDDKVEEIVQAVFEELKNRSEWAGSGYPFKLETGTITLANPSEQTSDAHLGYLLSLLATYYRHDYYRRIAAPKKDNDRFPNSGGMEDYFQACGTIAAAGLIAGNSISFGFPREDGTSFYEKLSEVSMHLTDGTAKKAWEPGASTNPKDAGVDIVAWRPFVDKQPGQIYLLGQCASGDNWQQKSPNRDYSNFHEYYWTKAPHSPIISAIFVPFDIRHDVGQGNYQTLTEAWHYDRWRITKDLGIIIDRFRLAYFFAEGLGRAGNKCFKIESVDMLRGVKQWVIDGMNFLRA